MNISLVASHVFVIASTGKMSSRHKAQLVLLTFTLVLKFVESKFLCSHNFCENSGTCVTDDDGNSRCKCAPNYTGLLCEQKKPCNSSHCQLEPDCPCQNSGVCDNSLMSNCICPNGFHGEYCEFVDKCWQNPCRNFALCVRSENDFICNCRPGFSGSHCQISNPCAFDSTHYCLNGGICVPTSYYEFICSCGEKYYGQFCQYENSCFDFPCGPNGICTNAGNGFHCKCQAGFSGTDCKQTDPCKLNPNYCGHHGKTGTCHRKSNTDAECECFEGFYGNHCEFEDLCLKNPCLNGGSCRNEGNSFECQCKQLYYGKLCEIIVIRSSLASVVASEGQHFIIPGGGKVGEKLLFHTVFSATELENLDPDVVFEWNLGDGSSKIIRMPELVQVHSKYQKRQANDSETSEIHNFEHVYNQTGGFTVQVFVWTNLSKVELKNRALTISGNETCVPTLRIHNVGHDNEDNPFPEYTSEHSIMAWAVLYMRCDPQAQFHLSNTKMKQFDWELFVKRGDTLVEILNIPLLVVPDDQNLQQNHITLRKDSLSDGLYYFVVTATLDINSYTHVVNNAHQQFRPGKSFSLTDTGGFRVKMHTRTTQIPPVSDKASSLLSFVCVDNCGKRLIPEKKTLLKCVCSNCKSGQILEVDLSPRLNDSKWSTHTLSSSENEVHRFIYIRENAVRNFSSPVLTVSCKVPGDNSARTRSYTFDIHQPPEGQNTSARNPCEINPKNGIAMKTKFRLNCGPFTSCLSPVWYSLYVKINGSGFEEYPNEKGYLIYHDLIGNSGESGMRTDAMKTFAEFILPSGDPANNFLLAIQFEISDAFSSTVIGEIPGIQVTGPENVTQAVQEATSYFSSASHDAIHNLLLSGNRAAVFRLILVTAHEMSINESLFTSEEHEIFKEISFNATNQTAMLHFDEFIKTGSVSNLRDLEQMIGGLFALVFQNSSTLSSRSFVIAADLVILLGHQLQSTLRPFKNEKSDERLESENYIEAVHMPLIESAIKMTVKLLRINVTRWVKVEVDDCSYSRSHGHRDTVIQSTIDSIDRDYFLEEVNHVNEFAFTDMVDDDTSVGLGLEQIKLIFRNLLDTLRRLSHAIGSGLNFLENPLFFNYEDFLSMYVGIFGPTEIPGMIVPKVDKNQSQLFAKNSLTISKELKFEELTPSKIGFAFIQIFAVVTTINPYSELGENHVNTPFFHVELCQHSTLESLESNVQSDSPHEIKMSFLQEKDVTSSILSSPHVHSDDDDNQFLIDTDFSNLEPEEITVYHFSIPHSSRIFLSVKNFHNLDISVALKYNIRPTCMDFREFQHVKNEIIYNGTSSRLIYQFFTSDSSSEARGKDLLDYYAAFWPSKESIDASKEVFEDNKAKIELGFSRLSCISKPDVLIGEWTESCTSVAEGIGFNSTTDEELVVCHCPHLSIFAGSLRLIDHSMETFARIDVFEDILDTTLVPFVVTGVLVTYLVLLLVAFWRDHYNKKVLPKLYVLADIKRIREETIYFVTLETGNNLMAGTSANVACQLYGERGRSRMYTLSDLEMDSTRQNGTADFLISSEKYLGRLEHIRIWHDNEGIQPHWYCRRIVIRDVMRYDTWFFFVHQWMSIKRNSHSTLIVQVNAATDEEIKNNFSSANFRFRNYLHELREHHDWFSGLTCSPVSDFSRVERLSCAMAVLCSHMFILVLLYGELNNDNNMEFGDVEINCGLIYVYGAIAGFLGLLLSIALVYSFRRIQRKRTPTIVVQGENPFAFKRQRRFGMSLDLNPTQAQEIARDIQYTDEKYENSHTPWESDLHEPNLVKIISYTDIGKPEEYFELFRIPSTDVINTEKWISGTMKAAETEGQDSFVQGGEADEDIYGTKTPDKNRNPLHIMEDFGLTGELVNLDDENPLSFNYIPANTKVYHSASPRSDDSADASKCIRLLSAATKAAQEDFRQQKGHSKLGSSADFRVELGETDDLDKIGSSRGQKSLYTAWSVCILIILGTCTVTIILGTIRLSYRRSMLWLASLAVSFLLSCLIIQPTKVLLTYFWIIWQIRNKKRKPAEEFYLDRLKVFWVKQMSEIKLFPLHFKLYFPRKIIPPLSGSKIFSSKMHSRREWIMAKGLLDLFMYSIFMVILLYIMLRTRDNDYFHCTQSMKNVLRTSYDMMGQGNTIWDVKEDKDFFKYMTTVFTRVFHSETNFTEDSSQMHVHPGLLVWLQNRHTFLLGVPRIRQLRAQLAQDCADSRTEEAHPHNTSHVCSGEFEDTMFNSNMDTAEYSVGWKLVPDNEDRLYSPTNDLWRYRTTEETGSTNNLGSLSNYGGGGYIAELGRTRDETLGVIRHIKKTGWIDTRTRAVFVEFNTYNPSVDLFNIVKLIFERSPAQAFVNNPIVHTTRFVDEKELVTPQFVTFIICTLYFVYTSSRKLLDRILKRRRRQLTHILSWALILDSLSAVVGLVACINCSLLKNEINEKISNVIEAPVNVYISLQHEEAKSKVQLYLYCALTLVCLLKLWSLLILSSPRFFIIGFTISITAPHVLGFLLMGAITLIPFAQMLTISFGTVDASFQTFTRSIVTLVYQTEVPNLLDYYSLVRESRFLGGLLFFSFNIWVVYIFRSIFISALTLRLQQAKDTSLQRPFRLSYAGYIWMKFQLLIPSTLKELFVRKRSRGEELLTIKRDRVLNSAFLKILTNHKHSIEVHRMNKMRKFAEDFMIDSNYILLSKKDKMIEKINKVLRIEEDRVNSMRESSIRLIKDKAKTDLAADDLEKYCDFNYEVLKLKCTKLEKLFNELRPVLRKYTKDTLKRKQIRNPELTDIKPQATIGTRKYFYY